MAQFNAHKLNPIRSKRVNDDEIELVSKKRLDELLRIEKKFKKQKQQLDEIIRYCKPHTAYMWSSMILSIILDCDFRESYRFINAKVTDGEDGR